MQWRRRKTVVNKKEQIWFALESLIQVVTVVFVLSFLLFVPPMKHWLGYDQLTNQVAQSLGLLLSLKRVWILVAVGVGFLVGLLQSHRIFGPTFAVNKVLEKRKNGDKSARVFLRKYDYMKNVEKHLNELFDQEDVAESDVIAKIKAIQKALEEQSYKEAQKTLEEVSGLLGVKGC